MARIAVSSQGGGLMSGEALLKRATTRVAGMFGGAQLRHLAQQVRAVGGLALRIVLPDGSQADFGDTARVTLTIRDPSALGALAQATLGSLAGAYVEGSIDIDGDIAEAVGIAARLVEVVGAPVSARPQLAPAAHEQQTDRADIGHHYDVGNGFYRLWLDQAMVYSCAYFETGAEDIDGAQRAKLDLVCRKLRLAPGERFLDVGCGWGALVLHAAAHYGARAVGITLSAQQAALAGERIAAAGLQDRAEVLLLDYRELPQRFGAAAFDKVASVGMFEHVGLRNLPGYFAAVAGLLRDRGLMLNHGITSADVDSRPVGSGAGDFIGKYVFPNGELPHLAVAVRAMAAAGFEIVDVESLRPHYALTLAQWSRRLEQRLQEAAGQVPERVLRVWRIYLAGCSHGFAQGWMNLYQVLGSLQVAPGPTELPLTRRWIYR
ncbi:MAG: class I SAM-dependent methyltransferase [Burkholderiaceae bacterium]|nr:class I SAM-dependent methyltransferase [Burkholderiaceae bacterium]